MRLYSLFLIALYLTVFAGCGPAEKVASPAPSSDAKKTPEKALITAKGSKIYLPLKGGKQIWEAEAASVEGDFIAGTGEMLDISCRLLENNKAIISGQAGKAYYDKAKQQIILSGGAKADWPGKKAKVSANKIIWQLESRQLAAEGQVHFSQGEQNLSGNHLKADFNLKTAIVTD
jgi:lipopolysaccharide export system protein LptA